MAITLQKGQKVDIGLKKVGVGLGWDPNKSGAGHDFDLDASAFMLNSQGKIPSENYFVFYNTEKRDSNGNPLSEDGAVSSSGDDTSGGSSEGDDETLTVDLSRVNAEIQEIIFTVTIHEAEQRKQNFGQVRNSFIRVYDAMTNEEMCKYELGEDFSIETAVEFGRLYRREGAWRFEALGVGHKGGLQAFINKYLGGN